MKTRKITSEKDKKEFQKIAHHLCVSDRETNIRHDAGSVCIEAIAYADPGSLTVTVTEKDRYIYEVRASAEGDSYSVSVSWVHEDGISEEREEFSSNKEHPVHRIVCMTDLFSRAEEI